MSLHLAVSPNFPPGSTLKGLCLCVSYMCTYAYHKKKLIQLNYFHETSSKIMLFEFMQISGKIGT